MHRSTAKKIAAGILMFSLLASGVFLVGQAVSARDQAAAPQNGLAFYHYENPFTIEQQEQRSAVNEQAESSWFQPGTMTGLLGLVLTSLSGVLAAFAMHRRPADNAFPPQLAQPKITRQALAWKTFPTVSKKEAVASQRDISGRITVRNLAPARHCRSRFQRSVFSNRRETQPQ